MKELYRKCVFVSILIAMLIIIVSGILYVNDKLPDTIFVNSNETTDYNFSLPVSLEVKDENGINLSGKNSICSGEKGNFDGKYKLFGLIELKNSKVKVVDKKYVYPVGLPIGLYLKNQGVMIIDTGEIENKNGENVSPSKNIVRAGEYIIKFNDISVSNKAQLCYLINENKEKNIMLTVKSEKEIRTVELKPQLAKNGEYMLGIWVRDDSQGIGTMTFVTEDNKYGALGHGISDIDTGKLLSSHNGTIYNANIWGIKKGEKGNPGGLCGSIIYNKENEIGDIEKNNNCGIYGNFDKNLIKKYNIRKREVAFHNEIKPGKAKVQFIMDSEPEEYDIEIVEINQNIKEKNMVIKITDKRLLNKTNGIVQGMSGSPIIQDGKVIGAVTHVMVNDPKKGYGIFIENMMENI